MCVFNVFIPLLLVSFLAIGSAPGQQIQIETASWEALSTVKPEATILIYLTNGGRMKQEFLGYDTTAVMTDAGRVPRSSISAISIFRPERLWDGTLRGGALGFGTLFIPAAAYDHGEGLAGAAVIGFLAGAGLGVLFDAGVAKPDKPVFVATPPSGKPASMRNWTLRVPATQLSGWLKSQRVQLMLKDGTFIRGTVDTGTETTLQIDVLDSSRQGLKGTTSIPTSEIGTVIFRQKLGGSTAAAASGGAISGFWIGLLAGVGASDSANEGPAIVAGAGIGALAGGLAAGFGISHLNTREITLVVQ